MFFYEFCEYYHKTFFDFHDGGRYHIYRNQSIDLLRQSMNWFLYDNDLCHERVKEPFGRLLLHKHSYCLLSKHIVPF